jgi:hypothetical protein
MGGVCAVGCTKSPFCGPLQDHAHPHDRERGGNEGHRHHEQVQPRASFFKHLEAAARACVGRRLVTTFDDLGVRSSVDVRGTCL